ncbi:hypothetical protein R1flu_010322 [Riccia fluitans]|uniref:Secreted protein n=1 Tax=Riccia fluitans TaxID=41844 RepID=A0ABD1Z4N5_9MARC
MSRSPRGGKVPLLFLCRVILRAFTSRPAGVPDCRCHGPGPIWQGSPPGASRVHSDHLPVARRGAQMHKEGDSVRQVSRNRKESRTVVYAKSSGGPQAGLRAPEALNLHRRGSRRIDGLEALPAHGVSHFFLP